MPDITSEPGEWMQRLDAPLAQLMPQAEALALAGHGTVVTYSRKVFIPLTRLCRDVCHYCTFATRPAELAAPYLTIEQVLDVARAGEAAGCREALFTLGDRPEDRFTAARQWLDEHGYASTLEFLAAAAQAVLEQASLLPHLNPGLMDAADYARLRPLSASMGIMLETAADRLSERGGPHLGSPDKRPAARIEAIRQAGIARVPFTTGILIGIGETRLERIESLLAIRDLQAEYGHIQEVIVQNFRAKPGTQMAAAPEPSLEEHLWTIAAARLILGAEMTIQAPPNLQPGQLAPLIAAGVNDWGGVSPVTPDHVNPEAPWPHLAVLEAETQAAGRLLRQRLAIGPAHARAVNEWADPAMATVIRRAVDGRGLPRPDGWTAGTGQPIPPASPNVVTGRDPAIVSALRRAEAGATLSRADAARLFTAEGADLEAVRTLADGLRRAVNGDVVTHVINRNINYTNICLYRCGFCAFSKGSTKSERGPAYNIDHAEIARRTIEAHERGASEVCLQGGIHPSYDGHTYLGIVRAVKQAVPQMHVHAFSPLEVDHGAGTLGMPHAEYLAMLRDAGLSSLPGTAAEVLADDVRAKICPDKLTTGEWASVVRAAHSVGLRTTSTVMFGHVDSYDHWAQHLLLLREIQQETGGFTEFVPLPFVHVEAPNWRKGQTRSGPTWREAMLMHAVARIALDGAIPNIQSSWVKLGLEGAVAMLECGVNDLGGTLMDESITRAAGGVNGQMMDTETAGDAVRRIGRRIVQRTTLYRPVAPEMA
jgi:FO synthase